MGVREVGFSKNATSRAQSNSSVLTVTKYSSGTATHFADSDMHGEGKLLSVCAPVQIAAKAAARTAGK